MSDVIYSAIGNEIRVKLLLCLAKKSKNVTEMINTCGLAQSAVSQHLAKLKAANLVITNKIGKEIYYSLRSKKIAEICESLQILERQNV